MTLYIYLCVAARSVVKSRRLTCPLGKSMALLFTALGLLLLLLRQDRYNSFLFLSFLLALGRELFFLAALCFFFFFLPLLLNRISRLVIDSNVNRWKAFAKSQKLLFPATCVRTNHAAAYLQPLCLRLFDIPSARLVNDPFVNALIIFRGKDWLLFTANGLVSLCSYCFCTQPTACLSALRPREGGCCRGSCTCTSPR